MLGKHDPRLARTWARFLCGALDGAVGLDLPIRSFSPSWLGRLLDPTRLPWYRSSRLVLSTTLRESSGLNAATERQRQLFFKHFSVLSTCA